MKVFLLALFVAAAVAAPAPLDEEIGEPVELIVNGLAEGEPLEIGDVIDIKLKEHVDGQVASSTNLLHPLTAAGLAEAAAALDPTPEAIEEPEVIPEPVILPEPVAPEVLPEPVILPEPVSPEVIPEPVILPEPVSPEVIPEPVILPEPVSPEVIPEPVILPEPVVPEVIPEPVILPEPIPAEILPVPAPQIPTGEVFNDGIVQVTVNAGDPGVLSTIQSWFNMVLNYFNDGAQTTQQIV